jgi:hypothetical protein
VFEMAAPIQSPAKCEMRSVIRFLNGKGECLVSGLHCDWFQDLINVWTMPATMLKNKVMYRQFIDSVAFVN